MVRSEGGDFSTETGVIHVPKPCAVVEEFLLFYWVLVVILVCNNDCDVHCRSCYFGVGMFFKIVEEVSGNFELWSVAAGCGLWDRLSAVKL